MIKIRVPGSTSNLGPGFDCLGMAFTIYNTFSFEVSDHLQIDHVEEAYNNKDNKFIQAYLSTFADPDHAPQLHVVFDSDVPISRGLGSSASLTVGGIIAGFLVQGKELDGKELLRLATRMEGHPDNGAPAIFGGLTGCITEANGEIIMRPLPVAENLQFTVLIPAVEVSTAKARAILPASYSRSDAVNNSAHAILLIDALRCGDMELLRHAAKDVIHEPYRKTLIPDFDKIADICRKDTDGVFLISGSGSTCLLISDRELSEEAKKEIKALDNNWQIRKTEVSAAGAAIEEENTWHPII